MRRAGYGRLVTEILQRACRNGGSAHFRPGARRFNDSGIARGLRGIRPWPERLRCRRWLTARDASAEADDRRVSCVPVECYARQSRRPAGAVRCLRRAASGRAGRCLRRLAANDAAPLLAGTGDAEHPGVVAIVLFFRSGVAIPGLAAFGAAAEGAEHLRVPAKLHRSTGLETGATCAKSFRRLVEEKDTSCRRSSHPAVRESGLQPDQELQDNIEQPTLLRAQSGRFPANSSRPG